MDAYVIIVTSTIWFYLFRARPTRFKFPFWIIWYIVTVMLTLPIYESLGLVIGYIVTIAWELLIIAATDKIYPATIYNSLPSYKKMKVNDYYNTIPDDAIIGELNDIKGFDDLESINKYWNIMQKMLLIFTYSKQDAKFIENLLDENQFEKISTTRKSDLKEHVTKSIDALIYGEHIAKRRNKNILKSLKRNPDIYRYVFNVYCCILTMREKRKNSK